MREYGSRHYLMYSTLIVLYLLAGVYGAESTVTGDDFYKIYEDDRISIKNGEIMIPVRPTMSAALRAALSWTPRPDLDEVIRKVIENRPNPIRPTITTLVDKECCDAKNYSTKYNYEYKYRTHHGPGLVLFVVVVWQIIKRCCYGSNSETTKGEKTADDEAKLVV